MERSQQTDWVEFYATADLADPDLPLRLEEWQLFYNWRRPPLAIITINGWNRLAIGFRKIPREYQPHEIG